MSFYRYSPIFQHVNLPKRDKERKGEYQNEQTGIEAPSARNGLDNSGL